MKLNMVLVFMGVLVLSVTAVSAQSSISDKRFKEQLLQDTLFQRDRLMAEAIISWRADEPREVWMTSLIRMTKVCLDASLICGEPDELLAAKRGDEFGPSDLLLFLLNQEGLDTNLEPQFKDCRFTLYLPEPVSGQVNLEESTGSTNASFLEGGAHDDARY